VDDINIALLTSEWHRRTLDTQVGIGAYVYKSKLFTNNYSPEQARLDDVVHDLVSTWFEEHVSHAA